MKASIKFREDQKPTLRAKVPLKFLGLSFRSAIEAGDSKELCLSLGTFFESGPSLNLSYRPNDSSNPFILRLKTGIGHFGSPVSAPMTMSAEFNLLGNGNPSFFLHFKPSIGDFAIRRSLQSQIALNSQRFNFKFKTHLNDVGLDMENSVDGAEAPSVFNGSMESVFFGADLTARTSLPLRDRAVLKLRWSVNFPAGEIGDLMTELPFCKMPSLVLNKIGIEHAAVKQGPQQKHDSTQPFLVEKEDSDSMPAGSSSLRKHRKEQKSEINRTEKNKGKNQNRKVPASWLQHPLIKKKNQKKEEKSSDSIAI